MDNDDTDLGLTPDRAERLVSLALETGGMNAALVDTELRPTWVHNDGPDPPDSEISDRTDTELFSGDAAAPAMEVKRRAIETRSRVTETFTFVKPWGQHRYRAGAEPIYDDDEVVGAMFAATDLSDVYRLLERTTDAVYTVDTDWEVTFWNDRMAERTGVDAADIVGENLWETFGDSVPEELEERYRTVMATGEPAAFEQYVPEPFDYWVEIRAFADDNGLSVYSRDVTERKEHEQRLETQRDTLDVLNQVLRHDIRNDLQLVLGYTDILADHVDEEAAGYLGTIRSSAEHAVELTTTAREISAVLFSDAEELNRVGLRPVLQREIEGIRNAYPEAVVDVEGPIPDCVVVADEMLDSVFRNLLKNAVQHNDKPVPRITVSTTETADEIVVRISDNGPGIPEGAAETVFGKGEKGLESEGTGIGLFLVQALVEGYDGDVAVEDPGSEGATFAVTLTKVERSETDE